MKVIIETLYVLFDFFWIPIGISVDVRTREPLSISLGDPLISIALGIWQEVKFEILLLIFGLELANDGEMPGSQIVLSVDNISFFQVVKIIDLLIQVNVIIFWQIQVDNIMQPAEMAPFAIVFSLSFLFFFLVQWLSWDKACCLEQVFRLPLVVCLLDKGRALLVYIVSK